jgi:CheY-like chemotaxis protein
MIKQHILIADSEPAVTRLLSEALKRSNSNCLVSTVHSGEEVLEILCDSEVDLLVTDPYLPGISGLELVRWVRACSPQTRAILTTTYGDDEIEKQVHSLNVSCCVRKPFLIEELQGIIQQILAVR